MAKQINRLRRDLTVTDAVVIGLGSMMGAGIFTALAPAASAAGAGLLIGLIIAGCVAFLNASSSAQLARLYPASGGTYIYARERLNELWAWLAGWAFIFGKFASCAAVALTFGYYIAPDYAHYLASIAIIVFTIINYFGIKKTANATKIIVGSVTACLIAIIAITLGSSPKASNLQPLLGTGGLYGILQSAGIWFFAFAGYSRIATLGEEMKDPAKSIPRAVLSGLGITLLIYIAVAVSALLAVGPNKLASTHAPLLAAVQQTDTYVWGWVVRIGAMLATLGVLVSLMTGISRTLFAMADDHKLPAYLAKVHPTHKVPYLAESTVGALLAGIVLVSDVRSAIGFSAFTVLFYYAITNMAAFTLKTKERLFAKTLSVLGFVGCLTLAFALPITSVIAGTVVIVVGLGIYAGRRLKDMP
jgi:APA family basic amino acid/polyamine antiporter